MWGSGRRARLGGRARRRWRAAGEGLRYNRFHTNALCTPTRQALLTGRNHHSVGAGTITEFATSAPGYTSLRPNNKAPLTETLKLNGYSTRSSGSARGPTFPQRADGRAVRHVADVFRL